MRLIGRVFILLWILFVPLAGIAQDATPDEQEANAQDKPQASQPQQHRDEVDEQTPATPVYVPPRRGAPLVRVGAGSRGVEDGLPFIAVITPEHTGFSSVPQPELFWYLSADMKTRFEFALVTDTAIDPIVELVFDRVMPAGLHSLDLAEHGVALQPGVSYQWSVALVTDTDKRSADIVSSGRIEYLPLSPEQQRLIEQADAVERPGIYAGEGYWYDSFAALSTLLAASPGDTRLLAQRDALLQQVGLDAVVNAATGVDTL
jgi:hypothetical protein